MVSHKIRNRNTACLVRLPCESAHRMQVTTVQKYMPIHICVIMFIKLFNKSEYPSSENKIY